MVNVLIKKYIFMIEYKKALWAFLSNYLFYRFKALKSSGLLGWEGLWGYKILYHIWKILSIGKMPKIKKIFCAKYKKFKKSIDKIKIICYNIYIR